MNSVKCAACDITEEETSDDSDEGGDVMNRLCGDNIDKNVRTQHLHLDRRNQTSMLLKIVLTLSACARPNS